MNAISNHMLAGAGAFTSAMLRNRLTILAYHGVDEPDNFEQQIEYLARNRTPVSLGDLEKHLRSGSALPKHAVLVTFDDGARSLYESGLPILEHYEVPGVAFVISDLIGTDQPFWWDEVMDLCRQEGMSKLGALSPIDVVRALKHVPDVERRECIDELRRTTIRPAKRVAQLTEDDLRDMEARGMAIGSHTASHPCLDQCVPKQVEQELSSSKRRLECILGHEVTSFAYPNGNTSRAVSDSVGHAGYETAFLFDHRWCARRIDPRRISRLRVDSVTPIRRFEMIVSGLHPLQHSVRGRR